MDQPPHDNKNPPDPGLLPPAILAAGSLAWKGLGTYSDIDFLFSITEERFSVIFGFLQNYGWWLIGLVGVIWLVLRYRTPPQTRELKLWPMVASCSLVAFLMGMLLAVRSSGVVPDVLRGWGGFGGNCSAIADMVKLKAFRDNYRLAIVCGLSDPTTEKLDDERITVSNLFELAGGGVQIVTPYKGKMREALLFVDEATKTQKVRDAQIWFTPILLPKASADASKVQKLSDVFQLGGKIVHPDYYR